VRSLAISHGRIADILQARGQLDEALAIRQQKELPVYERLGDVRSLLVCRTNIAITLLQRGRAEDAATAMEHLLWSYNAARERGFAEAKHIEAILRPLMGGAQEAEGEAEA
jgi:hypothetical protein